MLFADADARPLQDRLHHAAALRIVNRRAADQGSIFALASRSVPLVATAAVSSEQSASQRVFLPTRQYRAGRRCPLRLQIDRAGTVRGDRLDIAQVFHQRLIILRRQVLQAVFHRLCHRTGCAAAPFRVTGRQILRQLLFAPGTDTGLRIGSNVGRKPPLDHLTAEVFTLINAKAQIARRVAFAAVSQCGGQICASVPLLILIQVRLEAFFVEERQVPKLHAPALVKRERQPIFRIGLLHRRQAEQILFDRQHVVTAHGRV